MQQIINGAHSPILFLMKKPAWPDGNVCLGGVPDQLIVPFQRPAASKIAIGDISPFFAAKARTSPRREIISIV